MLSVWHRRRLISMSETNWSDLGVSALVPTGTVTLLLADVEGSTRLWETQPDGDDRGDRAPAAGCADEFITAHGGVRPIEQGEGDSFVAAFSRASDAVACALGSAARTAGTDRLPDRCAHRRGAAARRRQLRRPDHQPGWGGCEIFAHGGQTVLSGAAEPCWWSTTFPTLPGHRAGYAPVARLTAS